MYRSLTLSILVTGTCLAAGGCGDVAENAGTGQGDGGGATGTVPGNSISEGDYYIREQAELNALAGYSEVSGDLVIYDSTLTSLSLPEITTVGGALSVLSNDSLTSLSLPNLRSVGDYVTVETNDALTSFDLSALTEVGEEWFDNVSVKHNAALTSFDLSALTRLTGSLFVRFNAGLASFDLAALTEVGGFLGLSDNDALAQCLVDALVAQVEAGDGMGDGVDTTGGPNNPSCTCEEVAGVLQATCP